MNSDGKQDHYSPKKRWESAKKRQKWTGKAQKVMMQFQLVKGPCGDGMQIAIHQSLSHGEKFTKQNDEDGCRVA